MISSMTGFGQASLENEKISLRAQIKSVNGRFLETRFRMPREYSSLEGELKKKISQVITRGTLDISINRTIKVQNSAVTVTPNFALAKGWLKAARELGEDLGLPLNVSADQILRIPDIIQLDQDLEIQDWEKVAVFETVETALKECLQEKKREGEALGGVLGALLEQLHQFLGNIQKRKEVLASELKEKLVGRLKLIDQTVQVDPNRLAQEVLFLLEKADIAEELARAETHLKAYKKALKDTSGPVGKKLEFYTQELHREVNTMGSKTQALDVTLDIIDAKTWVERLREQVQNIE